MHKAAIAGVLAGLPVTENDDRLSAAVGAAQTKLGNIPEAEPDEQSYSREDVAKAADLVIELYGREAVAWAERIKPPGKELFAKLVLREVKSRLDK